MIFSGATFLVALLMVGGISSCASDTTGTTAPPVDPIPGGDTLVMSALLDSTVWIGVDSVEARYDAVARLLVVNYARRIGTTTEQVGLVVYNVSGVGEVVLSDSTKGDAKGVIRHDKSTTVYGALGVSPAGRVKITELDSLHARGSFSFTAVGLSGPNIGDTLRVTNGRFLVHFR